MTGRRRDARFLLSAPVDGRLHVREEVVIERWGDGELEVLSAVPGRPGETLALEVPEAGPILVTMQQSRAIVTADGSIRYRLLMSFDPTPLSSAPGKGLR